MNIIQKDSKFYKEHQLVMLPTDNDNPTQVPFLRMNQKDRLVRHAAGGEFRKYISLGFKPQHLYLLSDEKIKEGEWFLGKLGNHIFKCGKESVAHLPNGVACKKVVATTNSELIIHIPQGADYESNVSFPTFSPDFLEYFVKEWNKGNKIEKVLVEYEEKYSGSTCLKCYEISDHDKDYTESDGNNFKCIHCKEFNDSDWKHNYDYQLKVNKDNTLNI